MWGNGLSTQSCPLQRFPDLCDGDGLTGKGIIDIQYLDVTHRRRSFNGFQRTPRRPMGVCRIAVDELLKHPEPSSKFVIAHPVLLIKDSRPNIYTLACI